MDTNDRIGLMDVGIVRATIASHREGLDFADALHIAQAGAKRFLTLDKA